MTNIHHEPQPVALCITELEPGGAERMLTELALRLDRQRFTPRVYVLASRPCGACDELVARLEAGGVPTVFLGLNHGWQLPAAIFRLAGQWRRERPTLIQSFLYHANLVARLAARMARVPLAVSGLRVAEPARRWRRWIDRATSRFVNRYVAVSQDVAEHAQREGGLPEAKLTVIPNGVELSRFVDARPIDPAALGVLPGKQFFVFIGRLEDQKRPAWLLQLLTDVFQRLPDHDLVMIGEGAQRAALEQLAHELSIASRVHFTGRRDDIPEVLAAAAALVLPSGWEGMPNVVLEAMAAGRPIVACDASGVRELLGPSSRQVIKSDDSRGFAERLVEIGRNHAENREIAAENRRRAANFSLERMVAAYEQLWEETLASAALARATAGQPRKQKQS
ncbi:MAG: glycosyltransferase [Pirellulales bacterium]|nr:glycosyltransferase [Pirellulales bacterium]